MWNTVCGCVGETVNVNSVCGCVNGTVKVERSDVEDSMWKRVCGSECGMSDCGMHECGSV